MKTTIFCAASCILLASCGAPTGTAAGDTVDGTREAAAANQGHEAIISDCKNNPSASPENCARIEQEATAEVTEK